MPILGITIRPLKEEEVTVCARLAAAAYNDEGMYELAYDDLNDAFSTAKNKIRFVVAVNDADGTIVAFAGYMWSVKDFNIYELCWNTVHPDWQGRKIGSELIHERIKLILTKHPDTMRIEVVGTVDKSGKIKKSYGMCLRAGFIPEGTPYEKDGVIHTTMVFKPHG